MARPKGPSGFSLVELLVVMAIIGITLSIAVPNGLAYLRNYSITAAAPAASPILYLSLKKQPPLRTSSMEPYEEHMECLFCVDHLRNIHEVLVLC